MTRWAILAVGAVLVLAQSTRDGYRNAYRVWRETDPNLEREAGLAGAALHQRIDHVAAEAAKYGAQRSAFLKRLSGDYETARSQWLSFSPTDPLPAPEGQTQYLEQEASAVSRGIEAFANDRDPNIRRLANTMEQERAALAALTEAIAEHQKAAPAVKDAVAQAGRARKNALNEIRTLEEGLTQFSAEGERESVAWAEYYRQMVGVP